MLLYLAENKTATQTEETEMLNFSPHKTKVMTDAPLANYGNVMIDAGDAGGHQGPELT